MVNPQDVDPVPPDVGQVPVDDTFELVGRGSPHLQREVVISARPLQLVGDVHLVAVPHVEKVDAELPGAEVDGPLLIGGRMLDEPLVVRQQPAQGDGAQLHVGLPEPAVFHPACL